MFIGPDDIAGFTLDLVKAITGDDFKGGIHIFDQPMLVGDQNHVRRLFKRAGKLLHLFLGVRLRIEMLLALDLHGDTLAENTQQPEIFLGEDMRPAVQQTGDRDNLAIAVRAGNPQ